MKMSSKVLILVASLAVSTLIVAADFPASDDGVLRQIGVRLGVQSGPESEIIYRILVAEVAGKRGNLSVALENYRLAAETSNDPRIAERATDIALFMGEDTIALETSRRWHTLAPDSLLARQSLALALLRNREVVEAVDHLDAMREEMADEGDGGFGAINAILSQVPDPAVGAQVMSLLRDRYPASPHALFYYGMAAMGNDNSQAALEALSAAVKIDPDWSQAHLARAELLVQMDKTGQALENLAEILAEQPEARLLRMGYARLLIATDHLQEARAQFEQLVTDDPQDGESLFALGVLAANAEQFDLAVEYLQKVLALDVRIMDAYYELGKVEELRGNFEKALDWYAQIISGERYLNAQVRVATMEARLGNFPAMAERFEQLRATNPDSAVALYIAESEVLREEQRYQMSFDLLDGALQTMPDDHDLLYSRALIAERLDRLDVLEQDLRQIIAADPDNGHALNALGYTLADRTDRYEEALDYIQQALVLLPEDPAVLDSMGWVKYRLENYEDALKYLRQAYEINPDPEIASHLSEVLWVSGEQDEARNIWQESIDQHPEDEHLIEVQERFGL